MRICSHDDCGHAVADEALNFCPVCLRSLGPDAELESLPLKPVRLGEALLGRAPGVLQAGVQNKEPAGSSPIPGSTTVEGSLHRVQDQAVDAGAQLARVSRPVSDRAGTSGAPADLDSARNVIGVDAAQGSLARRADALGGSMATGSVPDPRLQSFGIGGFGGLPEIPNAPPLPSFEPAMGMREVASPMGGGLGLVQVTRPEPIPALSETIGVAVDVGAEFRVGEVGSLCVRFERIATPRRLEMHLHWEVEVDGQPRECSMQLDWHGNDYDQDAFCGLTPQRSGELRLRRLSVAFLPDGDKTRRVILTLQDVPFVFRVGDAPKSGPVTLNFHGNVEMSGQASIAGAVTDSVQVQQGNAGAASVNRGLGAPPVGPTPPTDLERRRFKASRLVAEPRPDWWARRPHTLGIAYSHRGLLSWNGREGRRLLLVCQRPELFQLGRQRAENQFVLRWMPASEPEHEERSKRISRHHFKLQISPGQITLHKHGLSVVQAGGGSAPGRGHGQPAASVCPARMSLIKPETLALGCHPWTASDGLVLRLTPLSNPNYCAVLVERLNNFTHLAYLCLTSATRLSERDAEFFQGLPRDLRLECVNGALCLHGPETLDLAESGVELRACGEDEFID